MNVHSEQDNDVVRTLDEGQGRRTRRGWLLALSVIVLVTALGPPGWRWARGTGKETPRFRTEPAARGALSVTVSATGTLEPTNRVDVGSELSGIVKTVEADYNDRVRVGQVLARLDRDKLEAAVKRSRAALASARARVLKAKASVAEAGSDLARLEKVSRLSRTRAVSESDLEGARANLARAEAEEAEAAAAVDEAAATLQSNRTDLDKTVIHAPINGIVLNRNVEPGQTVAASLQAPVLFTLAEDLTRMELHVDVDEADVGRVREGQEALFTVDAFPERSFEARITQVRYGAETVDGVVTYETVLRVDNPDLLLRPGMTATADVTVERVEDALLVPNAALRFAPPSTDRSGSSGRRGLMGSLFPRPRRGGGHDGRAGRDALEGPRVWSLRDGRLVPTPLETGASDGIRTVVLQGRLTPGQELVVDMEGPGS